MTTGRLFVVATPIGNLNDMSPRAVDVLRTVDLIAAEDTRHSKGLLTHFDIHTPLTSYHEHNEATKTGTLVATLAEGKNLALISDAGTPCISDPGYRLVRAAQDSGIDVVAVPGASSVLAALAVSGLPTDRFMYHGFFPRKRRAAESLLEEIARIGGTHVVLEAPNRLVDTLNLIARVAPADAEACVTRELTKVHEECRRSSPHELANHYSANPPRGECVVLLYVPARDAVPTMPPPAKLREMVESLMVDGNLSRRDAVRRLASELGLPKNAVYAAAQETE